MSNVGGQVVAGNGRAAGAGGGSSVILSASNVRKTYRLGRVDVPVLHGVAITVREGEWVAILGASGSGKSTLLHILGGLDRPDLGPPHRRCPKCGYDIESIRGDACPECGTNVFAAKRGEAPPEVSVNFRDQNLIKMSSSQLDDYRNQTVGFVFQFYHLLPELTVLENALLPAMRKHGRVGYAVARKGLEAEAGALLASFGLGHRLKHRPAELSGGERQRTAIARALINNPHVLLADEPTGNLDQKTGEAILDAVAQTRAIGGQETGKRTRTIVMVTHDQRVAARADRVVRLVDGRVVEGVEPSSAAM